MKVGRGPGAVVIMVWQQEALIRPELRFPIFLFLFGHAFKNPTPFLHAHVGTVNSDLVLFGYVTLSAAAL